MREHQLIDIERILVNPENPRHTQIMIADELFIMPLSSIDELDKKVSRIVQDIVSGKITSNTTKNNTNIEKYLYDNIENNASKLNSEREDNFKMHIQVDDKENILGVNYKLGK